MEKKSLWKQMLEGSKEVMNEKDGFKSHPLYADAQKRSMSYYGKTGEDRPLQDFINDPNLK